MLNQAVIYICIWDTDICDLASLGAQSLGCSGMWRSQQLFC